MEPSLFVYFRDTCLEELGVQSGSPVGAIKPLADSGIVEVSAEMEADVSMKNFFHCRIPFRVSLHAIQYKTSTTFNHQSSVASVEHRPNRHAFFAQYAAITPFRPPDTGQCPLAYIADKN